MIRTRIAVSGMVCPMCEAHVNDAVRNRFKVKKVTSSRKEGVTVILSEEPIDSGEARRVIASLGYVTGEVTVETVEKKKCSLFGKG